MQTFFMLFIRLRCLDSARHDNLNTCHSAFTKCEVKRRRRIPCREALQCKRVISTEAEKSPKAKHHFVISTEAERSLIIDFFIRLRCLHSKHYVFSRLRKGDMTYYLLSRRIYYVISPSRSA